MYAYAYSVYVFREQTFYKDDVSTIYVGVSIFREETFYKDDVST